MSKQHRTLPRSSGGSRGSTPPRWLLFAWFHLEIVPGLRCMYCHQRPGVVRFDDYHPQTSLEELLSVPLEQTAERVFAALLTEQISRGPRVHRSEPYCFACTMQHIDAVLLGKPELAGLKAVAAMRRLSGHPGVALLHETLTNTNVMLISLERTPEGLLRQIAGHIP